MGLPKSKSELRAIAAKVLAGKTVGQLNELIQWVCNASDKSTQKGTPESVPITGGFYAEPSEEDVARIESLLLDFIDEKLLREGANNGLNTTLPFFHITERGKEVFSSGRINEVAPDDVPPTRATTEHVLPFAVVKDTRDYLEQIVNQANGCYEKGWYDACSVMIRKLVEVLIIAVYEKKGEAEAIKKDGNFLMLGRLVDDILTRAAWNLGRETKTALPLLKSLGDRSAHNRHFMARKADVDRVLPGLRVAVEDLLHQAGFVQ